MAKIKGKWVFTETDPSSLDETSVNFTSNATSYDAIYCFINSQDIPEMYYLRNGFRDDAYTWGTWHNEAYKVIDFGEIEQEVSDAFLAWMQSNATQQEVKPVIWFTKLNLSDIVRTIGNRNFRKLSAAIFPQLTAPTLEITDTILNIYDNEAIATKYDVLANNNVITTVESVGEYEDVTISLYGWDGKSILKTFTGPNQVIIYILEDGVEAHYLSGRTETYNYTQDGLFLGVAYTANETGTGTYDMVRASLAKVYTKSSSLYLYVKTNPPTVSIDGNMLNIQSSDSVTQYFRITADNWNGSVEIPKDGEITTVDMSTIGLSYGTWEVHVVSCADGYCPSAISTVEYYVEPPEGSHSLTVNCTGYSGSASYWADRDMVGIPDGHVSHGEQIVGIMSHVYLQGSWENYDIGDSSATNCSIEFYDRNGNVITSGYASYAKVYDLGDNASVTVYDMD